MNPFLIIAIASLAVLSFLGVLDSAHAAGLMAFAGAVTHPTAVRNAIADLVVDSLDGGSPGKLVFRTSGDVAVATLTFSNPAFGSASSGTATSNAITSDTNAAGGTIAKATLETSAGTAKVNCSVTAPGGGGDIELSSVVVSAGQTVSVSSLTYSAPS